MGTLIEHYKAGCRLKDEKKFEEALVDLQQAHEIAMQDLEASKKVENKHVLPLMALTQCYTELGRHEEAITSAQKVVELDPNDQFSYIALSRAYQRAGMIPEAEMAMAHGHSVGARR